MARKIAYLRSGREFRRWTAMAGTGKLGAPKRKRKAWGFSKKDMDALAGKLIIGSSYGREVLIHNGGKP